MRTLYAFLASLVGLVVLTTSTFAAEVRSGERYVLPADEVVADDMYAAGSELMLLGTLAGDITTAGGSVHLKGAAQEDALFAGGTIIIDGSVADDLRAAGGDITISGSVNGDVVVAGGTIRINPTAVIGGDLILAGGEAFVDGDIMGTVRIAGGKATISGSVGGDVWNYTDLLTLTSGATVGGDLTNRSVHKAVIEEGATVSGSVIDDPAFVQPRDFKGMLAAGNTIGFFIVLFSGLLCYWLFKNRSSQFISHALAHFWKEALRGLLLIIILPLCSLALIISALGMPVGFAVLLVFILVIILAKVFAGMMLGGWINRVVFKKPDQVFTLQTIIGGNVVMLLLGFVPVVGGIVELLFFLVGFGAFWGYLHRHFWKNR